ncbi:MAG: 2-amino-4-hydroxy-6-hydroxymethyldihydropteridine diphosphokinase [Clostridiales bacterium]|nr:2-amino-4-hydroxy-6-hydroxymethyldihydropteridine diphosphokinase [Clostridiales bacterium]
MDKIKIIDLEVFAKHGVYEEEQVLGQKFLVSAILYTDTRMAGKYDDLEQSINYGSIAACITAFLQEHTFQLIETVTERLAEYLLLQTKGLKKIQLEIKKPWAPVGLPLKTVSVEIERGWQEAYIAFGSNMGNKMGYIQQAIKALKENKSIRVERVSSIIETEPYGGVEQDVFLNGCMKICTILPPLELLDVMQQLEQEAHRERIVHWGPRTLDLDLLFYGNEVMDSERLNLPHPEIEKRTFVLEPMSEIAPYYRHPVTGYTMKELLERLN